MKHYSESFNKNSRLIITPTLEGEVPQVRIEKAPDLKKRLLDVLQVQQDYFPCFDWVFPPPVFPKSVGPNSARELFAYKSVEPGIYSVYMHIPFCKTLCSFCYYRVLPGRPSDEMDTYVNYLVREMSMYKESLRGQKCESIYIGGGTPTSLDDAILVKLFKGIHSTFQLAPNAEVTVESAPDTLPKSKVTLLKSLGANRLSYGIQTLDEKLLASMNRYYTVKGALKELEEALPQIGNINIDTMYGFDDEPDDALFRTLTTFEKVGVPCLTIYSLDTQRSVRKTVWTGPPKDDLFYKKIDIYRRASELLPSLGYRPLFQNTFAKPGIGSYRHQVRRWDNLTLVALGVGSMGYTPRKTYQNFGQQKTYYQYLDEGKPPIEAVDTLTPEMEMARQVCTQLRFSKVDLKDVRRKYGSDVRIVFKELLETLIDVGYLERRQVIEWKGGGAKLTEDVIQMTKEAAPYNNVLPMLFSPDNFKQALMSLPEEYLESMPTPLVLTKMGATQSERFNMPGGEEDAVPVSDELVYSAGSCPVVARPKEPEPQVYAAGSCPVVARPTAEEETPAPSPPPLPPKPARPRGGRERLRVLG